MLGIAAMVVLGQMFILRQAWGIRDLWDVIWNNKSPEKKIHPKVRRHDADPVDVIEDTLEDWAKNTEARITDNILAKLRRWIPWLDD